MNSSINWVFVVLLSAVVLPVLRCGNAHEQQVRDIVWVWGNPDPQDAYELARDKPITTEDPGQFAQADPMSRARILGIQNIFMAGAGLPLDLELARRLTSDVASLERIVWELVPDHGKFSPPFDFAKKVEVLKEIVQEWDNVEGVVLDDMSTVAVSNGLQAKHITALRGLLRGVDPGLKLWGVVYTMSLDDEHLDAFVHELDGVLLAVWHARDVHILDQSVGKARALAKGKPIILCLYLYDYGENRLMPRDLLQLQCSKALELALAGKVQGIEFTLVNNDREAVVWTRDWLQRVGSQKIH
jgi:hypothetical protein